MSGLEAEQMLNELRLVHPINHCSHQECEAYAKADVYFLVVVHRKGN
jgi:hypothetical protein